MDGMRAVQSEMELQTVISSGTELTLLMVSQRGCAKAKKVKEYLMDKLSSDVMDMVHWEVVGPNDEVAKLGATRLPYFAAFNPEGRQILDFVAETPGALYYGLEDVRG